MKNDTQNSENNFYATVHEIQIKCSRGDAKIWHITKMERNNDNHNQNVVRGAEKWPRQRECDRQTCREII